MFKKSNLRLLPKVFVYLKKEIRSLKSRHDSLQKDYEKQDKDLKKQKDIIQKSKDHRAGAILLDQNSKLKFECELLGDQKMQADALKMQIHLIMNENEVYRTHMTSKLAKLVSKLEENSISIPQDEKVDDVPQSVIQDPVLVTEIDILKKELHIAREQKHQDEIEIFNSKQQIEEFKLTLEKKGINNCLIPKKWLLPHPSGGSLHQL
jgi:hypothetical protein